MTGVRGYEPGDREAVRDICYRTGFMGKSAASFWRHEESFCDVWTSYYTDREPGSLYVATIDDSVVGYLTGCVDTAVAPSTAETLASAVLRYWLLFRPGTAGLLYRGLLDTVRDRMRASGDFRDPRWPAHLHVNLLPAARGSGLGVALMERWLDRLGDIDSPGCHLGTLAENAPAHAFFEKLGFRKHGEPTPVPGVRSERGARLHQQMMVWNPR